MLALNDQLGRRESVIVSDVIRIKVGANENVDIVWMQSEVAQLLEHVCLADCGRSTHELLIGGNAGVDQHMLPVDGLDEVATQNRVERLSRPDGHNRRRQLEKVEFFRTNLACHRAMIL